MPFRIAPLAREGESMLIRQEKQTDFAAVYQLVKTAFAGAEHADGNEQDLVDALRKSEAFIPALSLVAEIAGEIAGYILFTKARAGGEPVLVLAPLAVLPGYRKRGVGGALIREGHRITAMLGYGYSLVLGSVNYYQRFGYVPAGTFGIRAPAGIPAANFMAVRLIRDARAVCGTVLYAKEFGISE